MLIRWLMSFVLLALPLAGCGAPAVDDIETGDLDALLERGSLRVVVPGTALGEPSLPRQGSPMALQRELAESFAASLGLDLELVPVFRLGEMLPLLEQGRADLVAANLTVTEARQERVDFSLPIDHVYEVVLVSASDESIESIDDLSGRRIMADPATSFWETLSALREDHPDLHLHLLPTPDHFDDEAPLDMIAAGHIDATVRDSNIAEMYLGYRDDLRRAFVLGERQAIAWAVRRDTPDLLAALNRFLTTEQLTRPREVQYLGDLPELKERRVLRILLPNTAASYFLWRGELVGFEYELARRFAEQQGMRLEVVVPPRPDLVFEWLETGRADIAGGFLEISDLEEVRPVSYTRPWHFVQPYLVSRAGVGEIDDWDAVGGSTVAAAADSQLWEELSPLSAQHGFTLVPLSMVGDAEEVVLRLLAGEFDYAVLEEHLLAVELAQRDDIRRQFPVGEPIEHAWAVRLADQALHEALNEFFRVEYRGKIYNILYRRYFRDERNIRRHQDERVRGTGQLSPWDDLVRQHAEPLDFDWRLIVAQMYQESRFDPQARSPYGATGLMQLMPRTAAELGVKDLTDPQANVRGGIRYLHNMRERFSDDLSVADRVWFALAAYNAGLGHVIDARRLAAQKGWDRDRWFDNVENAMLLLSQRRYFSQARHGYVRGSEPVAYVDRISARYKAYVQLTEEQLVQVPEAAAGGSNGLAGRVAPLPN
ncbi:transglycosylase, SLT family [Thioalkalivibrio nitratireducens DSM 14787]|uniref:Transglycosylase, SLT family n=1 Tax=Thioalkalivibrio nitratireducens (strain DSM 14787 / UNIQEM 213 / ALEN2) TaxID=1255043 RepID=L0E3G7_THIND|nr:transporter substrate-binding domain-containing protein [Thioalkalivibrio nitratireducens]AGA35191.1 transglycosylase, SLT family [Thioalkalivibrio nitratireducens DSM 14787]